MITPMTSQTDVSPESDDGPLKAATRVGFS